MAVFTAVPHDQIDAWLTGYDVGRLQRAHGIAQGVENTNYFVDTDQGSYVLTLIERISTHDLPFYLRLMKHLALRGIPCPDPVTDRQGRLWSRLSGKPATLVSRLPGIQVAHPCAEDCALVGALLARMHLAAADFGAAPPNSRGLQWWPAAFDAVGHSLDEDQSNTIADEIRLQQAYVQTPQYHSLPASAVHADCFRDNVLIDAHTGPGVIDFYFACEDKWLFDLAVACNDWCVDHDNGQLKSTHVRALLDGYQSVRALQDAELEAWPILLRAAALRFWLSRLYDHFLPRDAEVLSPKDPGWFERILHARRTRATEII